MIINKFLKTVLMSALIAGTFTSCVKDDEWSTPEILCNNRFDAPTISMADFAAKAPTSGTYKIPADGPAVILDGYVVSSDENGNFYKTISFQDKPVNPTVGLQIEVDKASNYTDFPAGSHIRIKANGLVLGWDRGTRKIGSVDPTYAIGRIPSVSLKNYLAGVCNGSNRLDVATLVPTQVSNLADAQQVKYLNTLVSVPNVQFTDSEVSPTVKTYIDLNPLADTNRTLIDGNKNSTVIRNSSYFAFGANPLPTGNGTISFVVSRYNTDFQMLIRGIDDVKFTNPRFGECETATPNLTLGELKNLYPSNAADPRQITADYIIEAYVSSSDKSGNIYKTLYVQDKLENPTQGLGIVTNVVNMVGKYPVGTKVYIHAKDLWLSKVGGIVQLIDKTFNTSTNAYDYFLSNLKMNTNIVRACTQPTTPIVPLVVNSSILSGDTTGNLVGTLVKFEKAQFSIDAVYGYNNVINTYANPGLTTNRTIEFFKADGTADGTIIARNSAYSTFANASIPSGSGSALAILSKYNSDWQLYIRDQNEVDFSGNRFDSGPPKGGTSITYSGSFIENFESYPYSSSPYFNNFPAYVNDPFLGSRYWELRSFSGNKYVQLSANGASSSIKTYFIVPIDFTAANSLSFKVNVGFYNGDALKVYTTTNYTPLGNIGDATLNNITSNFTIPKTPTSGYGTLVSAGTYNLPTSLTGNGFIVFEYDGGSSNGITTTVQLDDITVQ